MSKLAERPDSCYCDCGGGGPCEHDWTGPEVILIFDEGRGATVTCVRCGCTAIGHDMRVRP